MNILSPAFRESATGTFWLPAFLINNPNLAHPRNPRFVHIFPGTSLRIFPAYLVRSRGPVGVNPTWKILRLSKKFPHSIISARAPERRYQARAEPRSVRDHPLERGALLRGFSYRHRHRARSAGATLPNILATDFRFHLPSRLFRAGCARLDTGFFSHGP